MNYDPFEDYIKQTEPDKKYKAYAWSTAIGLQAVLTILKAIFQWRTL